MTKQDFIFSLLRSALWQQPMDHFDMTPYEYKVVMEDTEKQGVQGLVTDCLRTNNMGLKKKCVIHMLKMQRAVKDENQRINMRLVSLVQLLNQHDINYVVVKGPSLAALYPKPGLRIPGDIDFWTNDIGKTRELLNKEWGQDLPASFISKEVQFKYEGVTFDFHRTLVSFRNSKHRKVWKELLKRPFTTQTVCDCPVNVLETTTNTIFIFVHIFFHFIREGIGLRQLCDLTLYLEHHKDKIDRKDLSEQLSLLGIERAFRSFGWILIDKLGLSPSSFPLEIKEKDKKITKHILEDIWKGGNFGVHNRHFKKLGFLRKVETMYITIRNCISYFRLAPSELIYDIPLLVRHNIRLFVHHQQPTEFQPET